jgi:hypothetical protein
VTVGSMWIPFMAELTAANIGAKWGENTVIPKFATKEGDGHKKPGEQGQALQPLHAA